MAGERDVADLARAVADVYQAASDELLSVVATETAVVANDADSRSSGQPDLMVQAKSTARVAAGARKVSKRLDRQGVTAATDAVSEGQKRGVKQAEREMAALLNRTRGDYRSDTPTARVTALAESVADLTRTVNRSVLRQTDDAYRDVLSRVMVPKVAGTTTKRLDLAKDALAQLADRGIVGFVDKSGRRWEIESYIEMATRTASARAMVQAQLDRFASTGADLVFVPDSPRECALCRPFEHRVLSISNATTGTVKVKSVTGGTVTIDVLCSVDEAYARGFGHPNCTHGLNLFMPGATKLDPEAQANPQGYEDRQTLRALERNVRHWRKRELAAVTKVGKAEAKQKVKAGDANIREHVEQTGLIRQRNREKINVAR